MALSYTDLKFEIMQSDYSWYDAMAAGDPGDVREITVSGVGLSDDPESPPQTLTIGQCNAILKYNDGRYFPSQNGVSSGKVDKGRKVRMRAAGKTSGKVLQATFDGVGGDGGVYSQGPQNGTVPQVNANNWWAQPFQVTAPGLVTGFTFACLAPSGSGTATWKLRADNNGIPGTVLDSGTFTPSANDTFPITAAGTVRAYPNTTYYFELEATGTLIYQRKSMDLAPFAAKFSTNQGVTWNNSGTDGMVMTCTTSAVAAYISQQVTNTIAVSDVFVFSGRARAQFDSQYNSYKAQIVTSGDTPAATTLTLDNEWAAFSIQYTTAHTAINVTVKLIANYAATGLNSQVVEFDDLSLTKNGGANLLTNPGFETGSVSPWAATNGTANTITLSVINDYWIIFHGKIDTIQSANPLKYGPREIQLGCVDEVKQLHDQSFVASLQKNKTSDQLAAIALAVLPTGTLYSTRPGTQLDAGRSSFPICYDGYTEQRTSVLQALNDAVKSELARMWAKRCGTVHVWNRDYLITRSANTAKLSLADGVAGYDLVVRHGHKVRNKITATAHARATGAVSGVIGKMDQSFIYVDPAVSQTITITFKDSAGNTIGADSVITPLVASTDYVANAYPPGSDVSLDVTTRVTVTVVKVEASQITLTLTADTRAFVNFLQVRGLTVTTYNPTTITVSDSTSVNSYYGEHPWTIDLPFQVDPALINSYVNYFLSQFKNPFAECWYFEARGLAQINGVDLLGLELGDVISISNSAWGMTNIKHMITRIEYDINPTQGSADPARYRAYLERLDQVNYWLLGVAGYTELGQTTILGI